MPSWLYHCVPYLWSPLHLSNMDSLRLISTVVTLLAALGCVSSQYDGGYSGGGGYNGGGGGGYNAPKINILMHKQALSHDGSFNYAFSADNGLQQGEVINPDGSRQGSYSYVDPSGRTISLKYQAGKDGFRVLEGDHLPRAPPLPAGHAHAHAYVPQQAAPYRAPQSAPVPYRRPQYSVDEGSDYESSPYRGYDEESSGPGPSGPHSFGNGFSFEFGG